MKILLTQKQKLVLSAIKELSQKLGRPPTLSEIQDCLGYGSVSAVQRHTDALKQKGILSNSRDLIVSSLSKIVQIPLVGNVAAGVPLFAVENVEAYVTYDCSQIKADPDTHFFLRAVGDSMNMAKIRGKSIDDGDFVLVRMQNSADIGSRIVALIGEDATVKKLSIEDTYIKLEPESSNPKNKPILIFDGEELLIQGLVVDVVKKGGV